MCALTNFGRLRPTSSRARSFFVKFGPLRGPTWSISISFNGLRLDVGPLRPILGRLHRDLAKFDKSWAELGQIWPVSTKFGAVSTKFWPDLGQLRPACIRNVGLLGAEW